MLKITITGYPAEGKTTLASEIGALLQCLKMNVSIQDRDLEEPRSDELHQGCIEAMRGREVLIETVQLRKAI
jgi:tRNA uridine 5-carbamoylmethylation protein Kti12